MRAAALAVLAVLVPTAAAPAAAADAQWPQAQVNPQPLPDDVILPMPCGGAMAFRPVRVPADGPLSDRLIRIGSDETDRGYLEGRHPAYIAGSFAEGDEARMYLIGKYEISRLQYRAFEEPCPQPVDDLRLPATEVSWHDAIAFADRYSRWLREHAPDRLPAEDGAVGFVRLPTEAEWEFAARGGIAVSESEFAEPAFPMPDGPGRYAWSAGPESAAGQVQRIGLLQPNPLGIHDILGNVDEIVLDPFRLNKLDRLHGQAGGFVVRGGNFATAAEDVRTAARQEVPFYRGADATRGATTGLRLAVGSHVVTSRDRLRAIEQDWQALGTEAVAAGETAQAATGKGEPAPPDTPVIGPEPLADPIAELDAIAAAASDPNVKDRLGRLQLAFRAGFQAREAQRDRAAKARLRLGTFLCQKLRDDGGPIDTRKRVLEACIAARGAEHERCEAQKGVVDAEEQRQWDNLRYYADTIVTLVEDYPRPVLDRQLAVLRRELDARGLEELARVADLYYRHAEEFRAQQTIARSRWLADCKAL
jgi:hypothetical protein